MGSEKTQTTSLDEKAKALANEPDEESKVAKMLRTMPKWRYYTVVALSIFWLLFQLYIKLVKPLDPWLQLPLHMVLALVAVFLFNPMAEKYHNKLWWIYDIYLIGSSLFVLWYFVTNAESLNYRLYSVDPMTNLDIAVAVMLIIAIMETVRRVVSLSLFAVICFFIAYA